MLMGLRTIIVDSLYSPTAGLKLKDTTASSTILRVHGPPVAICLFNKRKIAVLASGPNQLLHRSRCIARLMPTSFNVTKRS